MGLMQKALETYQQHECSKEQPIGIQREGHQIFAPIFHLVTRADLEITLDCEGTFQGARNVGKKEPKIVIPVTEESAGRTNGERAHPFSDQLCYLAAYNEKKHGLYLEQLRGWAMSPYTHPNVNAVLNYIEGGTILNDLEQTRRIRLGKDGIPENEKRLVRWRVLKNIGEESASWLDQTMFECYIRYYQSTLSQREKDLCMLTGEMDTITSNHPRGVVPRRGSAKLISSNDKRNFTYRGRFTTERETVTVGYTASQKAHSALSWLVAEQGVAYGNRTFLCWNPKGITVPSPTMGLLGPDEPTVQPSDYQRLLKKALEGYQTRLPEQEDVVIAVLDTTTEKSSRLAVTYYNELRGSDFLQRLYRWDRQCCWYNWNSGVQSPLLPRIVNCAYGTQREEKKKKGEKGVTLETDDKLMRQQVQRLLACRVDQVAVPRELVDMLVNRASMPQAFEEKIWKEILFTACAMVNLKIQETGGENAMSWTLDTKDRDFQYGRLLAVYEKVERDTYDKGETREPNAMRLMTTYRKRPYETMAILEEQLVRAYFPKLSPQLRANYKKCIGEIMRCLTECAGYEGKRMNETLKPNYLLGYYLQRNELYKKKTQEEEQK